MLELSSQSQGSVDCALCYANLDSMSITQREIHYETHFSSMIADTPSSANAIASSQSVKSKVKKIWPRLKETDDFWYPAHTSTPPPSSFTPGIVSCSIQLLIRF